MNSMKVEKLYLVIYSVTISIVIEILSVLIIGFNIKFLYSLILGLCSSILNFSLLEYSARKTLNKESGIIAIIAFMFRMVVYGFVFYKCVTLSAAAGIGCILGFLAHKIAILIEFGIKGNTRRTRKEE